MLAFVRPERHPILAGSRSARFYRVDGQGPLRASNTRRLVLTVLCYKGSVREVRANELMLSETQVRKVAVHASNQNSRIIVAAIP